MKRLRLMPTEKEEFLKEVSNLVDKGTVSELKDLSGLITKLDEKNIKKPTIYVMADVMLKMEALVRNSPVEISWHCLVKRNIEENSYLIYDIVLFPQINSAAATNTDQEEYAKWLQTIMLDEDESKFDDMRMHGHSHVNMGVFSSGVDDGYQTDLLRNVQNGDYYIFMILNKKRDICTLLYDYAQQVMFENKDIEVKVVSSDKKSFDAWATNNIKEFCKEPPKPTYPKRTTPAYPRLNTSYDEYDYYYGYPDYAGNKPASKQEYQPKYAKYLK